MVISTEHLSKIKTSKEFADWIFVTLTDLYTQGRKSVNEESDLWKFTLNGGFESVEHAMTTIYDRHVPDNNQRSFREGIGIALHKCTEGYSKKVNPVINGLINLIGSTKASESLEGLLEISSNDTIVKSNKTLLYDSLAAALSFPPDNKIYEFTHKLANSTSFNDGFIFESVRLMIECDSNHSRFKTKNFKFHWEIQDEFRFIIHFSKRT